MSKTITIEAVEGRGNCSCNNCDLDLNCNKSIRTKQIFEPLGVKSCLEGVHYKIIENPAIKIIEDRIEELKPYAGDKRNELGWILKQIKEL
jgi:hypothetical protein